MPGLRSPLAKGPTGVCWAGLACGTSPLRQQAPVLGFCPQGPTGRVEITPRCPHPVPVLGHSGSLTQGGERTVGGGCEVTALVSCFGKTTHKAVHHLEGLRRGEAFLRETGLGCGVQVTCPPQLTQRECGLVAAGRTPTACRCEHIRLRKGRQDTVSTSGSENKVKHDQILDPTWCMNTSPQDPPQHTEPHTHRPPNLP